MVNSSDKERPQLWLAFLLSINSIAGLQLIVAAGQKSFPNKSNYGNFGRLMTAMRITSRFSASIPKPLKGSSLHQPPWTIHNVYRRVLPSFEALVWKWDAPYSCSYQHEECREEEGRPQTWKTHNGVMEGEKRESEVLVLGMRNIYWANKLSVINYNLQYIFLKGSERRGNK